MKRKLTFVVLLSLILGAVVVGCNQQQSETPAMPSTNAPAMPSTNAP